MSLPRRILAVDDDRVSLQRMGDHLSSAGFQVELLHEPTRTIAAATALQPHLILLDRQMPVLTGPEVLRSLRAFVQTAGIPAVILSGDDSVPRTKGAPVDPPAAGRSGSELDDLRSIRCGAVDVIRKPFTAAHLARLVALLAELAGRPPTPRAGLHERAAQNLIGFYRRDRKSGALVVNPGTPFEGRALFEEGELAQASYGPAVGQEALNEMMCIEDGAWSFLTGADEKTPTAPWAVASADAPAASSLFGYAPRVLFVDDEPSVRKLISLQLTRAGFQVDTADDGDAGHRLATTSPFDLIIADLNMPRLDGWGMLRLIKADHRTRETPLFFLSAHDDYRETLKAARAGAIDYLAKTGRADVVVQRSLAIVAPRLRAFQDLKAVNDGEADGGGPGPVDLDLNMLGPQWVLRALARLRCTGVLEAKDDWGKYRVRVQRGLLGEVNAVTAGKTAAGVVALGALFVSQGASGKFEPGPEVLEQPTLMPFTDAIARTCAALNEVEDQVTGRRLAGVRAFDVDEELYGIYLRIGSDRDLAIARAICEQKVLPADLGRHLSMEQQEVEAGLRGLLRRQVISFPSPSR